MRNKLTKLAAIIAAVTVTTAMTVPVMAAAGGGNDYTPVAGTSTTMKKFLIMDSGDTVPNATFNFTAAPGSPRSASTADNEVMQVLAGIGTPTVAAVTFGPSNTTATSAGANIDVARTNEDRTGTASTDLVQLDAGEKYATQQTTISFSGITFDEPGIYRYVITETADAAHAAAGIAHDTDNDRILDVYVTDDGTGTLVVSAYVLHTDDDDVVINNTMGSADVAAAGDALTDKTDGFTNEYSSKDLVFAKEVTGNQASRDKYFEFTVTASGIADTDTYVVSLEDDSDATTTDGDASATSGTNSATIAANAGKTNPTSVTGAQLKAGVKFYLQHGQSIAIRGLAPNATYSVTENAEDYKPTASGVTGYTDATSGTIGTVAGNNKAVMTSYLNQRSGIIPTGVMAKVWPGIILAGAAGVVIYAVTRRKEEDA